MPDHSVFICIDKLVHRYAYFSFSRNCQIGCINLHSLQQSFTPYPNPCLAFPDFKLSGKSCNGTFPTGNVNLDVKCHLIIVFFLFFYF